MTTKAQKNSQPDGPDYDDLQRVIAMMLAEDMGSGDITSQLTIPEKKKAELLFVAREEMIACGTFIPTELYKRISDDVQVKVNAGEGQRFARGDVLVVAQGNARALLTGERIVLNLMQHLSGVATLTRRYVDAVEGTKAVILDTRKTIPGLRLLDKYAVRIGGGQNHRLRLDDMVLIKDNHIALCGDIGDAIQKARAGTSLLIEVECDTLTQVKQALLAKPDRILLDNMSLEDMREAVQIARGKILLEASGEITLDTVRAVAATGVDYISVGKLTHSAPAVDIAADMVIK